MRIGLTGGTGFVGSVLLDRALADGHEFLALARKPQKERSGIIWVRGDLDDHDALRRVAMESDVVLHLAGAVNAPDRAAFERANVAGTLNLLEACAKASTSRFVFVSSLSAREPGLSAYGASKARAEKLVKASGLDWTIVRPPAIYGPHDTEMLDLFRAAKWGVVPVPATGRVSVIHADDLSRLLLALLPGSEEVTGKTFEPDDGRPYGWGSDELARAIGWGMGRRVSVPKLSRSTLERVAKADQFFRRSHAKLTLDRAAYFSHPDWVVSASSKPPISLWQPRIETRQGLKATAQWYREQGWL